ncbi:dnaK protein [Histomonas meleagridis]|uniref:dnaK protein n=1 Tax=Histomonas meleagridis TaxID=135588 RepID=UPI00355A29A5|nr:dnaK protein [Histomonas meleagridis]KAH0805484.1 dnaK protein [Histomonas meleagridis]
MWIAAGLDFGNKNCVIGVPKSNGVDVVLNQSSNRLTPTMITYTGDRRYSGDTSLQEQSMYLSSTITQLKRLVCLQYNSKEREIIQNNVPFQIVELNDGTVGIQVPFKGETLVLRPEQCIAYLFKEMDKIAKTSEPKISRYVIAVSPWWTQKHRRAILNACKIGNLQCLALVNSTTAAAITFTMTHPEMLPIEKPVPYVFIDFGNSSMNVAVALLKHGYVEIVSTASDTELGGAYFSYPLIQYLVDKVQQKYNIDPTTNPRAMSRFRTAVEKLKKTLSINPVVSFEIPSLMNDVDVSFLVKRQEFESQITELLSRIEAPIRNCLESANLKIEDIAGIQVLGGASRVPAVKAKIAEIFGKEQSLSLNLDECFAQGSGYLAALLSPGMFKVPLIVKDVIPYSIIAEVNNDTENPCELFKQFSPIPNVSEITVKTTGKSTIKLISNGEEIANIEVSTEVENEVEVAIRFRLNQNGIIEVECAKYKTENDEEVPAQVEITIPNDMTNEELEAYRQLEENMSASDEYEEKVDFTKNSLESSIFKLDSLLKDNQDFIDPENELENIQKQAEELRNWFYENEFEHLPIEEYESRLGMITEAIQPIEERIRNYQILTDTIPPLKEKLEKILTNVKNDKVHLEDEDSINLQEELNNSINELNEILSKPKYTEIEYNVDAIQESINQFDSRAEELKNKKVEPQKNWTPPQPKEEEVIRQKKEEDNSESFIDQNALRQKAEQIQNDEQMEEDVNDFYDPWAALFGKPMRRRNMYPRRRQYDPFEEERRRQEESRQREAQLESERRAELQRKAEEERRRQIEEERRRQLEEQKRAEEERRRRIQEEEEIRRKMAEQRKQEERPKVQREFHFDGEDDDNGNDDQGDVWANVFGPPRKRQQRSYGRPMYQYQRNPWGGPSWQNPFF